MCPADCGAIPSPACNCRGLSSYSVISLNPCNNRSIYVPRPFFPVADPWMEEYGGHLLDRKMKQLSTGSKTEKYPQEPSLPKDPRNWSRDDVANWVQHVTDVHRLPTVHLDRFLMNGKALCLMSIEMFVNRVPLGGKLLYKDFQLRLSSALYS